MTALDLRSANVLPRLRAYIDAGNDGIVGRYTIEHEDGASTARIVVTVDLVPFPGATTEDLAEDPGMLHFEERRVEAAE